MTTPNPDTVSWDIPLTSLSWRIQSTRRDKTKALYIAYPSARDISEKLDEVFGWDNWQDDIEVHYEAKPAFATCYLRVRREGEWITKIGVGHATDIEPWKGAESDAFKRAAAKLGIGRNVYSIPPIWGDVTVGNDGKAYMPNGYASTLAKEALRLMASGDTASITTREETAAKPVISEDAWNSLVGQMGSLTEDDSKALREKWDASFDFDPAYDQMTVEAFEKLQGWVAAFADDPLQNVVEELGGVVVEG